MRKTIYETDYDRLVKLDVIAKNGAMPKPYSKSHTNGFMDLVLERVEHMDGVSGNSDIAFSMAHYFRQNGDLCKDPEIVVVVYPTLKMVEALTFEQTLPPIYQVVFPEPGKFYPQLRKDLNNFLRTWLNNLIGQGHGKTWVTKDS